MYKHQSLQPERRFYSDENILRKKFIIIRKKARRRLSEIQSEFSGKRKEILKRS